MKRVSKREKEADFAVRLDEFLIDLDALEKRHSVLLQSDEGIFVTDTKFKYHPKDAALSQSIS